MIGKEDLRKRRSEGRKGTEEGAEVEVRERLEAPEVDDGEVRQNDRLSKTFN